jgi:hypothetical protein
MIEYLINMDYLNLISPSNRTPEMYLAAHKHSLAFRKHKYGSFQPILDVKIMIASHPKREAFHAILAEELVRQGFQFEFDYDMSITIGEKRERMYRRCSAKYCLQIDDDDWIAHDLSLKIEEALRINPNVDCVVYNELVFIADNTPTFTIWGLEFDCNRYGNIFMFSPGPKMCIKTKIARNVEFQYINNGEDMAFREAIKPLLHTQERLEGWGITYEYTQNGSSTGSQENHVGQW